MEALYSINLHPCQGKMEPSPYHHHPLHILTLLDLCSSLQFLLYQLLQSSLYIKIHIIHKLEKHVNFKVTQTCLKFLHSFLYHYYLRQSFLFR